MKKNIKRIFLVATLLVLLVSITAISASDLSDDSQTSAIEESVVQDTGAVDVSDNSYVADAKTTKNIKKESKTHIVNNDTVQTVFNKEGTSPYNNAGFSASLLGDEVEDGDTLDFQGQITGNYNLSINKAVNIISSTNDANISLNTTNPVLTGDTPGNHFIITREGSYTNVTGINFYNTQLFVYNATCVTLDNINAIVYDQRVGGGVGQTSIRENSTNITVKNSNFYTFNNGGSSTLVLAWADNCTIMNNTINAGGESGNLLYLTTYNLVPYPPSDVTPNSNNLIINNTIGNPNLVTGGVRLACVLTGSNNTIKSNKIYGEISSQFGVGTSEIQDTVIEDNNITGGIIGATHSLVRNNTINGNAYIYYNSTVENNRFNNVTLSQDDIKFRYNNVTGTMDIPSSNNNITNNIIISPYDYAIKGGTNCIIKDNYISTYYTAGDDAIINGTDNIIENNTPQSGVTLTITDDTYETYFDSDGKINNPLITNYSTIVLSGEFNNRIFDIQDYILNINSEGSSTILKSSQIISRENSRIKVKSLTINNTDSNIESAIILDSQLNTIERCNLIDYSTSTDNSHRTIMLNADNNIITRNNINTSAPSVNIDYTKTPILPDCISIVVSSSNNNITNNNIQCVATTNNNEYGTIEAIAIQSPTNAENNNISHNTITVRGSDYVYGINIGANANNNILTYNNIKVDSTIYSAGIQAISPANNNNISYNNINVTAATSNDKSAYGILVMNDSYDTAKIIGNNTIMSNNLRVVGFNSYGIEVYKSDDNKVKDNTITITNANYATGISLTGENNNIILNKLSIKGKSNQTSASYDNILPTTAGINIVNSYNNSISQNMMNVTKGSGIKLDNATKTIITSNNLSVKTSVGLNLANSQENMITLNNITTDNTNVILINESTNNNIDNNRLITSNAYVIDITGSTGNNINNNYMTGSNSFGNLAVNNSEGNLVAENMPSFDNAVYINNITYSNYFDDEGNIKDNSITADSLVVIVGNLYDKDMIFNVPVNITVYGSTPTIYNGTIIFKEGSNGSNTTATSTELTSQILITNYDVDSSSIIIENTGNINISTLIYIYGQNSTGIKITNSENIQLYNTYISGSALNDTCLDVDKSTKLELDIRANPSQTNAIGMKFSNTENVNITNSILWSTLSGLINTTIIQINENTTNININNTMRVESTRQGCHLIKINATPEQPATNITFDGTMEIMGNGKNNGRNVTAIHANNCQNSKFGGNIIIYDSNERFLAYDIVNSNNNLFNSTISKTRTSYTTNTTLAKLTNSNNNTITNINFTIPYNTEATPNSVNGITLIDSNNNKIINNTITINDQYTIYLINSNENTIQENYLNSTTYGDYSVLEENSENNIISDNIPEQLKLTDENYNQYFNENSELITKYDVIEIASDINNKDLKLKDQVYIFTRDNYQLNNVSIYLLEGSDNSIIEGLNFNNANEALIINNTQNIEITDNTIILPDTAGEAIIISNSDNITIKNNYIETKDLIANLAIKTIDSTNIQSINNTPIAIITDDEYSKYFENDGTFKYDLLDAIILGSDLKNKDMTFNNKIMIQNPDKYTIYNGTLTLNENASNTTISNLIFNNTNDGKASLIIKSLNVIISENQIYQTNNNTKIIQISNITGDGESLTQITNNNITFNGNNNTGLEISNTNSVGMYITENKIKGTGNDNIILDIQNIENPAMSIGSNEFKLNTTQPSTVININNTNGTAAGIAFYMMQNIVVSTTLQNTTPLIQISNNPFIAYVTMNFIESKDLKGDQGVSGSPQYTMQNYPMYGMYNLVEVTHNIPETMIVNKTYDLTFTIKDLLGDNVNKGILLLNIFEYGEYMLENTNSTINMQFKPTTITDSLSITIAYMDEQYEYAMLTEIYLYIKVVPAELIVEPITATAGDTINITAKITADGQTVTDINKGKVVFKVNGKTLKDANGKVIYAKVINGVATIENYEVPNDWTKEGTTIEAVYSGSTQCDKLTSEKTNITVATPEVKLTITPITNDVQTGSTVTLKAKVAAGDKAITTGKIVFKVNGKTVKDENGKVIYAKVDSNGEVSVDYTIPESFKAGTYTVEAVFTASGYDKLTSNTTMTVVKS